jgi:hypothetical protein
VRTRATTQPPTAAALHARRPISHQYRTLHIGPSSTYNIPYNINRLCLRKRQGPSPQRNLEKPRRRPHAVRARVQPKRAIRLARHSVRAEKRQRADYNHGQTAYKAEKPNNSAEPAEAASPARRFEIAREVAEGGVDAVDPIAKDCRPGFRGKRHLGMYVNIEIAQEQKRCARATVRSLYLTGGKANTGC